MRFGLLRVVEYVGMERNPAGRPLHYYRCICDCGNEYTATSRNLLHGDLVSCGCYRKRRQSGSKSGVAPPHSNAGEAMSDLTNAYYGKRLIASSGVESSVVSRFNVRGYRTYVMGTLYEEGAGLPPKDSAPAIEDDTPAKDSNEATN
jgi:hypothetical protein